MKSLRKHLIKCLIAGVAALLPIGGTLFLVLYLENQLSASWLKDQPYYRFGMGIVLGFLVIYLVGLAISTFVGRWLWTRTELMLVHVPLLGPLYQTLKQMLGYGEGPDAMFKHVVLVPCEDLAGEQLGFVTSEIAVDTGPPSLAVFIPAAPNPSNGKLIYVRSDEVKPLDVPVNQAMKALISVGALPLHQSPED